MIRRRKKAALKMFPFVFSTPPQSLPFKDRDSEAWGWGDRTGGDGGGDFNRRVADS